MAEPAEKVNLIRIPGMLMLLLAVAAGFGSFSLMLPVVPLAVLDAGHSKTLAGAATAIFMIVTVVTQLFTTVLVKRWGYRAVLCGSAFLLGIPSLIYVLSMDPIVVLGVAGIRGIGFGTLCVAQYALVSSMVPTSMLGRASGALGIFCGGAQMIGLPLGLWLSEVSWGSGYATAFYAAALVSVAGIIFSLLMPSAPLKKARLAAFASTESLDETTDSAAPKMSRSALIWALVLPALALSSVSMGYGAVSSFLPAAVRAADPIAGATLAGAMLSIIGGTQMIVRFWAGNYADKVGRPGVLMLPGLALSAAGMAGFAVVLLSGVSVYWMLLAVFTFGIGFGLVQNEALLELFAGVPHSEAIKASTAWNVAFDSGTGIGSIVLGMVAGICGFSGAFIVASGLVSIGWTAEMIRRVRIKRVAS